MIHPSPDVQTLPGSRVRVLFHHGAIHQLGDIAKQQNASRVLLVSDPGIVEAGHVETAMRSLYQAGVVARLFDGVAENPTTVHVDRGLAVARKFNIDLIVGLGGGSSMDCAKGVNFLLTNGGRMQDYWGVNKATKEMLPLIAVPTTSGTGSEAQSAALITDPDTHQKMACWDEKAAARVAILDPQLTATQPRRVAAATGIDALSHAVETAATTKRNQVSLRLSKEAWHLLESSFERSLADPTDATAREAMLLGAHLAGCAIENSMLGAAHAAANPLTAHFDVVHGHAVGVMLPHVIRFNSENGQFPYADLAPDPAALTARLEHFLRAAGIPLRLSEMTVSPDKISPMAEMAARQWTAQFNPRPIGVEDFTRLYQSAL